MRFPARQIRYSNCCASWDRASSPTTKLPSRREDALYAINCYMCIPDKIGTTRPYSRPVCDTGQRRDCQLYCRSVDERHYFQRARRRFFSQDLNGIVLNGQSLSLNVMLDDEVLARMLLHDRIGVSLLLFTTATTFPGTAGPSTGYLLDENGSQIGGFQNVGSTQSSGGAFGLPMSLITTQTMGTHAVDISGAHYNTIFPSSGYTVTNARLRFTVAGASQLTFGTAQQLPEPSSLVLLLTGCGAFLLNRRRTSRHQT
jgi:hypothetical protein